MSMFFTPIAGAEIVTVDSYEDQDISEYGGVTSNWTTQSSTSAAVTDGSYSAEYTGSTGGEHLYSTSGLPAYPAQGDTFRVNEYKTTGSDATGLLFGVQSGSPTSDYYMSRANANQGEYQLYVKSGGSFTKLASTTGSPPTGEALEHKIAWKTDDSITITYLDSADNQLAQISATDTTFTSGGIGIRSSPYTHYTDYWRIP